MSTIVNNRLVRTIAAVLMIAAVVVGGLSVLRGAESPLSAQGESDQPTATVVRGSIEETITANGTVASSEQATLSFASSGHVVEVLVEEGQAVEEGQVLARLDGGTVEDQIARARAGLVTVRARLAQAELAPSEAELSAAEAALTSAEDMLERLLAGPTESDQQAARLGVEAARNQLWAAQAQRDATQGNPMSSQAQIDGAEASLLSAEVAVEQALLNQRKLGEPATDAELAAAESQVAQARSQLEQALDRPRDEDVAVARAQVAEAALALAQAEGNLEDLWIVAPFDGTVLTVAVVEGEIASPGAPAIAIADTQHLVLDVLVDEHDVAQIAEGSETRLSFEALPREAARGTVTRIASSATLASGGVAYLVEVAFETGDLPVRLGMTTDVEIITTAVEDALLIPSRAVTEDREAGRYYVTRLDSAGNAELLEVTVGLISESFAQVTSGVSEGDVLQLAEIVGGRDDQPGMFFGGGTGMGRMGGR